MRSIATDWYNRPLASYVGAWDHAVADGREIGIEIETEGRNLPRDGITGWVIHTDGSLRGESAEYVFRQPEARGLVPTRLATLSGRIRELGSIVNDSYRTSVHVHLNARNMLLKQVYNQVLLYIIFEDVLAEIAGKDRIGNLFCLRAKDAEFFLEQLRAAMSSDNIGILNHDNLRYSAVNPRALFVHGSLEFRSFRGTTDIRLIQQWVDLLFAIKDAAVRFANPISIVQDLSTLGPEGFAASIFTRGQIASFERGWQDKVYAGVQLIQHCAYVHDWIETDITQPAGIRVKVKTAAPVRRGRTTAQLYAAADIRYQEADDRWAVHPADMQPAEPIFRDPDVQEDL